MSRRQQIMRKPCLPRYWLSINEQMPDDIHVPINCDKFTKVLSWGLKERIITRTKELAARLPIAELERNMTYYASQIADFLVTPIGGRNRRGREDIKGFTEEDRKKWEDGRKLLLFRLLLARKKAGVLDSVAGDQRKLDALIQQGFLEPVETISNPVFMGFTPLPPRV
jgi:hypothetical protein